MTPAIPNSESLFHNNHGAQAISEGEAPEKKGGEDMDDQLQRAAVERLPTFRRVKLSLFGDDNDKKGRNSIVVDQEAAARKRVVDVTKLGALERHVFIERLITKVEEDNLRLLTKFKERIDRMTLLLGPPGCGKTTLLKALSGKLQNQSLKVTGEITYNGYKFNEFVPQKTSAYISQYDQHISEMTVRETLDFSARCQGIGNRADLMEEICRKEKQAGIIPEPDIDTYMKAISAEGLKRTLQTDYILKVVSRKDQAQYWHLHEQPHHFVSVDKLVNIFQEFHVGKKLREELSAPSDKSDTKKNALSFDKYSSRMELFKACMDREWLLIKRDAFVYVSRTLQVSSSNVTMGQVALAQRSLDYNDNYYWISVAALLGFWMIFNIGFTFALSYLEAPGRSRMTI
ncbi:hypothetical protein Tsubulata_024895, partial [Turnera subulata]